MKKKNGSHIIEEQNGFSLLEILISILIFTAGAIGLATMQVTSIHGNTKGRSITEASLLGSNIYEEIFTLPYDHPLLMDTDGDDEAGLDDGTEPIPETPDNSMVRGKYTISWNVAENAFMRECKTVAVHIRWSDKGTDRVVSMHHVVPRLH